MEDKPWLKRYDLGVPYTIDYPPVPLFYFLEESALKYPDSPCTIFKGARISYREMNELCDRLAAGLASLGIKKADRVGLFMPNTPQFVMAYFAILKVGGVVVATNPLYSPKEIEHQVNDSGIEVMLVMSNFYNLIKKVQPNTKIRTLVVTNLKEALPSMDFSCNYSGCCKRYSSSDTRGIQRHGQFRLGLSIPTIGMDSLEERRIHKL